MEAYDQRLIERQHYAGILFPGSLVIICLVQRSLRLAATKKILTARAWVQKALSIAASMVWPRSRQVKREAFNDRLSGLATRNLFSWTFFTEGIRAEERSFWKHEWLEKLVSRELGAYSSESSSSGIEGEGKHPNFEYIRRWQDDVEAVSDWESQSSQ